MWSIISQERLSGLGRTIAYNEMIDEFARSKAKKIYTMLFLQCIMYYLFNWNEFCKCLKISFFSFLQRASKSYNMALVIN